MILRLVSSMNSTRTWVTPPLEPIVADTLANVQLYLETRETRTSTAEDFDDFDKLHGNFAGIHLDGAVRRMNSKRA